MINEYKKLNNKKYKKMSYRRKKKSDLVVSITYIDQISILKEGVQYPLESNDNFFYFNNFFLFDKFY
jgi:hypothetical protein